MDDPLYAMLFAEELVEYVLKDFGFEWEPERGIRRFRDKISKKRFTKEIGMAVVSIINANSFTISGCYDSLVEKGVQTIDNFRFESSITTIFYLKEGYDNEKFLELCASLSGISVLYFRDDNQVIAEAVSQLLAYILNFFIFKLEFDPVCHWLELAFAAQHMRRKLTDSRSQLQAVSVQELPIPPSD